MDIRLEICPFCIAVSCPGFVSAQVDHGVVDAPCVYFNAFPKLVERWMHNQVLYLFTTGLLHGLTNLGGPLLSSFVVTKYPNKYQSRATIAICYGSLVAVQLISLYPSLRMVPTSKSTVSYLVLLALAMYFLFDKWVFHRLSNEKFKQVFGPILVLMSALLLLRAWM